MATYLPGSNVKSDSMQTLYLMNPSYTGYTDSPGSGSMVLVNPATGVANQVGNSTTHQQQQQYSTFSIPSVSTIPNPNVGNQNASVNTQGYHWSGGNELLFLPSNDMREDSQSLAARLNSISQVQETTSGAGYGVRNLSPSAFQEQMPFIPSGVALGLTAENLQPPAGAGQILSLSLSSQQSQLNQLQQYPIQHPELGIGSNAGFNDIGADGYLGKRSSQWVGGNLNLYRASPNMVAQGYQDSLIGATGSRQISMLPPSPKVEIYTSRYLKPVQDLLNEVVSIKKVINNNSNNQARMQSWPTSTSHTSLNQDKGLSEVSGKDGAASGWAADEKDAVSAAPTLSAPENTAANQEPKAQAATELSTTERQELQMKKAKLMTMLDEVDQRYKQYHHQMQIVVASFESTAGFGTAQTYTALALQTISKHFRCLKDAIKGQIRVACKALGEEDIVGQGRGETSRLRFIDQQLRQQRALQQLGMMQQHPWRPQRGLPERSVSILRAWLFEHFLHPYPKDSDKVLLARQTGLSRNQVSNWFINARVRLWKPMVEEMYAEEMKEADETGNPDKPAEGEEDNNNKGSSGTDGGGNGEPNTSRQVQMSDPNADETKSVVERVSVSGSLPDNFLFQDKEGMGQVLKKARSSAEESPSFLSPSGGTTLEFKSHEFNGAEMLAKLRTEDRHLDGYSIPQGGMSQDDNQNMGGYSMFQMSSLNRYPSEGLAASYGSNTGVSLTLGLQHSEGLSLTGGQQQYLQGGQGQMQMVRRQDSGINTANYYDIQDISQGHSGNYEALSLQDRKRFTGQMLQNDFS